MKKALVRPDMQRVFQVEPAGSEFPVAPPLEWRDCADDVRPETHDFDGSTFIAKPVPPAPHPNAAIKAQLDALDVATRSARGAREVAIGFADLVEHLRSTTHPLLPATNDNVGIIKARDIEAQAAALRAQLIPE